MKKDLINRNIQKVRDENLNYFSGLMTPSHDGHQMVGQTSVSHQKRFLKIMELGDYSNKTLLDIGCGIAGFYEFLKNRNIRADYWGLDIVPQMIESARETFPEIKDKLWVGDFLESNPKQAYDFVVSVGPLNLKFKSASNLETTFLFIKKMCDLSRIGFAISMTSALTRKPQKNTFYYSPADIVAEVTRYCPNVRLDHTYLPHDFTLFGYKKDLYDPSISKKE